MSDLERVEERLRHRERELKALEALGAYHPNQEHDACGVGLIAAIDGAPRREIVELAIKSLKAVWHRGAVDADGKTGDGAGIRIDVPQDFFKQQVSRTGHEPSQGDVCVRHGFPAAHGYQRPRTCAHPG